MKTSQPDILIDVRVIPPRSKHATIFNEWQSLEEERSLLLVNDHDPLPLYYQFAAEYVGHFQWEYLERGPGVWRVRITKGDFRDPGFTPDRKMQKPRSEPIVLRTGCSTPEPLVLDVRPIFEKGGSPCNAIESAVERLQPGQPFILLVPFEPHPLFAKLGQQGFSHTSRQVSDGSWRVEFKRGMMATPPVVLRGDEQDIVLDARGLEPPEPLVRTLEALAHLKKRQRLRMRSERKPMHLFEQLESRGFAYDCTEQDDHSFITQIWHGHESANASASR